MMNLSLTLLVILCSANSFAQETVPQPVPVFVPSEGLTAEQFVRSHIREVPDHFKDNPSLVESSKDIEAITEMVKTVKVRVYNDYPKNNRPVDAVKAIAEGRMDLYQLTTLFNPDTCEKTYILSVYADVLALLDAHYPDIIYPQTVLAISRLSNVGLKINQKFLNLYKDDLNFLKSKVTK